MTKPQYTVSNLMDNATRLLPNAFLGLVFVLLSSAWLNSVQADVTYSNYTFTGSGTYSSAVNAGSHSLTVTPTTNQTITLTGGVSTTGTLTHNSSYLVLGAGTTNSFGHLLITNNSSFNGTTTTINGTVVANSFALCNSKTAYLTVNDGATFTVKGGVSINDNKNAQGIITQNGGTVNFNGSLGSDGKPTIRLGHWPNTNYPSRYDLKGGTLNIPNSAMAVGWDGYAEFNITGGTANVKGLILDYGGGKGTLTLRGGTLNVGSDGVKCQNTNYVVYLGQGTISASANHTWSSNMTVNMYGRSTSDSSDNPNGYTTFDVSSDKTITLASTLKGVGGLKKTNVGTLDITASNTGYSGSINVQGGTLKVSNENALGTGTVTLQGGTVEYPVASGTTMAIKNKIVLASGSTGNITKSGAGTLTISASELHASTFNVNGGTLQVPANFNADAVVNVNASSNLILGADATTVASIQMNGLTFNGGTVNFDFQKTTFDSITLNSNNALTLTDGSINLNFVDDSELLWLENAAEYKIISGTLGTLDPSNIALSSPNWKLSTKSDGLYLVRATSDKPYYDATSTEEVSKTWTIDGTNKIGAKLLSGDATHNEDVVMNSDGEFYVADGATLTQNGEISGEGKLLKTTTGTLVLTAENSYEGGTYISNGTLKLAENGTLGTGVVENNGVLEIAPATDSTIQVSNAISGTGKVVKSDDGTAEILTANTYSGGTTISGGTLKLSGDGSLGSGKVEDNANLEFAYTTDTTVGNAISGSGQVTQSGTAITTLTGTNTYSGGTTISGGTLKVTGSGLGSGNIENNSALEIANAGTVSLSNVISGTGSVTKSSNGELKITGQNTYSGGTTISAGTVTLSNSGSLGTGDIVNKGTLNFNNNVTTTVSNAISGIGTINKNGTGTTTFTEGITANTFVHALGKTYLTAGNTYKFSTLRVNSGTGTAYNGATMYLAGDITTIDFLLNNVANCTSHTRIGEGSSLTVTGNAFFNETGNAQAVFTQTGGTVQFTTSTDTAVRIGHWSNKNYPSRYDISGGSFSVPNTTTYVGWDGYAELNITGGTVSLKGLKLSHGGGKGTLTLRGGKLEMGSNGVTMTSGKTAPTINLGQGTLYATDSHTWSNLLTINLYGRSATDSSDNANGATTIEIPTGKSITFASKLTGVGGISVTGGGTLNLTGNISTSSAFINVSGGSTVNVTPSSSTYDTIRQFNINGGTILVKPSDSTNQFRFSTSNPIVFGADGGTLTSNCNFHFGANGTISTTENGKLSVINGTGGLNLNNKTITFDTATNSTLRVDTRLSHDNSAIVKSGNGILELTYANTYTSGTTINAGILKLSGNGTLGTNTVTINSNGTLEVCVDSDQLKTITNKITGSGTILKTGAGTFQLATTSTQTVESGLFDVQFGRLDIKGAYKGVLDVQHGAVFSPGNSVGDVAITGDFTLENQGTLLIEVGSDASGNLIADSLSVTGTTLFKEGSIVSIVLDTDSTHVLQPNELVEISLPKNILYGDAGSAITQEQLANVINSYYFRLNSYDPATGKLTASVDPNAVPEPSTWALLLLGFVGLMKVVSCELRVARKRERR